MKKNSAIIFCGWFGNELDLCNRTVSWHNVGLSLLHLIASRWHQLIINSFIWPFTNLFKNEEKNKSSFWNLYFLVISVELQQVECIGLLSTMSFWQQKTENQGGCSMFAVICHICKPFKTLAKKKNLPIWY